MTEAAQDSNASNEEKETSLSDVEQDLETAISYMTRQREYTSLFNANATTYGSSGRIIQKVQEAFKKLNENDIKDLPSRKLLYNAQYAVTLAAIDCLNLKYKKRLEEEGIAKKNSNKVLFLPARAQQTSSRFLQRTITSTLLSHVQKQIPYVKNAFFTIMPNQVAKFDAGYHEMKKAGSFIAYIKPSKGILTYLSHIEKQAMDRLHIDLNVKVTEGTYHYFHTADPLFNYALHQSDSEVNEAIINSESTIMKVEVTPHILIQSAKTEITNRLGNQVAQRFIEKLNTYSSIEDVPERYKSILKVSKQSSQNLNDVFEAIKQNDDSIIDNISMTLSDTLSHQILSPESTRRRSLRSSYISSTAAHPGFRKTIPYILIYEEIDSVVQAMCTLTRRSVCLV